MREFPESRINPEKTFQEHVPEIARHFLSQVEATLPLCAVYRKNYNSLRTRMGSLPKEGGYVEYLGWFPKRMIAVGEGDIFKSCSADLERNFGFHESLVQELSSQLERQASLYIILVVSEYFRRQGSKLYSDLKKLEKLANKLEELLIFSVPSLATIFVNEKFDENGCETNDESLDSLRRLLDDIKILSDISSKYKNSELGKFARIGKSGPMDNAPLREWVESMAYIWVGNLKRSITTPSNSYDGREKFLEFIVYCFSFIHAEVEADTVRNMYEKIRPEISHSIIEAKNN